jgi:hypothetical protein
MTILYFGFVLRILFASEAKMLSPVPVISTWYMARNDSQIAGCHPLYIIGKFRSTAGIETEKNIYF